MANTHLFFHPLCSHIRALQIERLLGVVAERLAAEEEEAGTRPAPAFVLCGDLNSQPVSSAGALLRDGVVTPAHPDWCRYNRYNIIATRPCRMHDIYMPYLTGRGGMCVYLYQVVPLETIGG